MTEIVPAIIGENFLEVSKKINQLEKLDGSVEWAQIDVMDGLFVPEYSWQSPAELEQLDGKLKLEAHLMLEEPENVLDDWLGTCDRVIVHLEATNKLTEIIDKLDKLNQLEKRLAVAVLLQTDLAKLAPLMGKIKNIQLMSIATIGHHGEPLDKKVYERISFLRKEYPDVKISVDGGVTLKNAEKLIKAGADRLVIGSAIWKSKDISKAIQTFNALRRQN
ncbi:MAG: hypothetical protein AAB364_00085 [Patescibacteria group bacterium]|mgnify:FL=1